MKLTEDILSDLVNDEKIEVRKAVFSNPNCTAKLPNKQLQLSMEINSKNKELFHIIVKHKNVSDNLVVYF